MARSNLSIAAENKLANLIERMNTSKGYVDNFDSFVDFALFPFLANPNEYECKNYIAHRESEIYKEALLLLGDTAEDYHDCFGNIFMDRISHGANGQFFTPESVCEFMAGITDPQSETINDCCCGSGRLLLAGLKKSRENNQEPWIYASDIDRRCCRLALLNLCLNSARGSVTHMDALMLESWGTWHIDRVNIAGKWLSWVWYYDNRTDMDALNAERNKQATELLKYGAWVERKKPGSRYARATETQEPTPEPEVQEPAKQPQEAILAPTTAQEDKGQVIPPIPKGKPVQLAFDF